MLFIHFIIIVVFVLVRFFESFGNEAISAMTWSRQMRSEEKGERLIKTHNIYAEINTGKTVSSHQAKAHQFVAIMSLWNFSVVGDFNNCMKVFSAGWD